MLASMVAPQQLLTSRLLLDAMCSVYLTAGSHIRRIARAAETLQFYELGCRAYLGSSFIYIDNFLEIQMVIYLSQMCLH